MAELGVRQWELGGLVFGDGTPIVVTDYAPSGKPEIEDQDQKRPRRNGLVFGRDTLGGQLHTFEFTIDHTTAADARATLRRLSAVWHSGADVAGVELPMRMRLDGGDTVVVFGRPRKFAPAKMDDLSNGRLDYVAEFQARDGLWYSDQAHSVTLDQIPPDTTGLRTPWRPPISTQPSGVREGVVFNGGNETSPIVATFRGPSSGPSLALVGTTGLIKLDMTIPPNSVVVVDTQRGTATQDGTGNVAGRFTRNTRLFGLPPGASELRYQATDATATSSVTVAWREASTSF